jgi:phosphoglycolate phosphatase
MHTDNGTAAVLFDIDGTLISTGGAGAVAWRRAFDDLYGIPADIGRFTDAGMTDPEVGRLTFESVIGHAPTADELERIMARRIVHLPDAVAASPGYKVLPGVESLLARLAADGYLVGLTTGGVEEAARIKLERGGLNAYFSFGGFGSDSPVRSTLTAAAIERAGARSGGRVSAERCFVVGDTPLDVDAARQSGAVSVAVATGHFTVSDLRAAGADHVLTSLEEDFPL